MDHDAILAVIKATIKETVNGKIDKIQKDITEFHVRADQNDTKQNERLDVMENKIDIVVSTLRFLRTTEKVLLKTAKICGALLVIASAVGGLWAILKYLATN